MPKSYKARRVRFLIERNRKPAAEPLALDTPGMKFRPGPSAHWPTVWGEFKNDPAAFVREYPAIFTSRHPAPAPTPGARVRWDPEPTGSNYIETYHSFPHLRPTPLYVLPVATAEGPLPGLGADREAGIASGDAVGLGAHPWPPQAPRLDLQRSTRRDDDLASLLIEARAVAADGYQPDRSERAAVAEVCDRAEAMLAALKAAKTDIVKRLPEMHSDEWEAIEPGVIALEAAIAEAEGRVDG